MNNHVAFFIAVVVASVFLADAVYFHLGLPLMAGKLIRSASEWMAFWR